MHQLLCHKTDELIRRFSVNSFILRTNKCKPRPPIWYAGFRVFRLYAVRKGLGRSMQIFSYIVHRLKNDITKLHLQSENRQKSHNF